MSFPTATSPACSSLSSIATDITADEELESSVREKLAKYQLTDAKDPVVTILGGFVKCLPRDGARNISNDIICCGSDEELRGIAYNLLTAVLVPMKAHGKTPIASPSPRFGAQSDIEDVSSEMEPSTRNDQSWLKKVCLERDDNRCVISGYYDNNHALSPSECQGVITGNMEAAHIIPFSLGSFAETERWNTAIIWESMYRCFPGIQSRANLSAATINNTENAMTINAGLHTAFGKFQFALQPTGTENVYRLETYPKFPTMHNKDLPLDRKVILIAHSPHHPLPSASILEAHAAIANILHMTGMGEYIEKIMREQQVIHCFASDGTTNVTSLLMVF